MPAPQTRAFTLIELLAVVAIIAILVVTFFAAAPHVIERGKISASLNNLRQIGVAFQSFGSDHDMQIPIAEGTGDRWPRLLQAYLSEPKVYADPGDFTNYLHRGVDPTSNSDNNTSYVMNGFNDLGASTHANITVGLLGLDAPGKTIVFSPTRNHGDFYMDADTGNLANVPNKKLFTSGSNYLFADGSVQFIRAEDYRDDLWLAHKTVR